MCIRDSGRAAGAARDAGHRSAAGAVRRGAAFRDGTRDHVACLLYTSDAADERSSVDLGGRRIIKKKTNIDKDSRAAR